MLLCCFVFGAGYITPAIPNGDVYIAGITGIVVLSGGFFHIHQRKSITQLSLIDAAFWVYLIYTLLNAHSPVDFGTIIRTISIAGIWWYVRQCDLSQSTTTIAMWAMYSGVGQTLIGLLQMMRLISSNHSYFMATGTFNNPGVWGGYLAIMLAIVLPQVSTKQRQQKTWLWMGSCIILIGILLSNSRAAWLATLVTIILLLWLQYRETMMKKRIHLALFLALPIIGYLLYILHPASIDARWHIWKVGLKMFSQSPLFGVGTGGFAVHFMPTQADYLSTATWEVQRLADDNLLAFNDLLLILSVDTTMVDWLKIADERYYKLVQHRSDTSLYNPYFNKEILAKADQQYRKATEAQTFYAPEVSFGEITDISHLSPNFMRQHIEHAFAAKERNPFARGLDFQDFLNYILPYRAMDGTPIEDNSKYSDIYEKYLHADTTQNLQNIIWRYNLTADRLRFWGGTYPFDEPLGSWEMYFLNTGDCVNKADRAVINLRACGIPAALEYNIAYKLWAGRHYHVSVPTSRGWETFNPEESLPEYRHKGFKAALNVYRIQFAQQPNAPFTLRGEEEPIPDELSSPFITDVTHNVAQIVSLALPFTPKSNHRLAYLASFRASDYGLLPVTWGIIDKKNCCVTFQNVVPNHLYYPIYLNEEGETIGFDSPFFIKADSIHNGFSIQRFETKEHRPIVGYIERTYPRKPEMLEAAQRAVGTFVIASDDEKFTSADTIGRILKAPNTTWEDLPLATKRPYRFYRVCGASAHQHVYLSEIAFLSDCDTSTYTTTAPYNEHLTPEENERWKQLWDAPIKDCIWKAEYDGRPQTAPDRWPDVTLKLSTPKRVNRLRYLIKHAGNTIEKGETYELRLWSNGYWKKVATYVAEQSNLTLTGLYEGQLYWLNNIHGKQESLPFIIDQEGQQFFPQGWQ